MFDSNPEGLGQLRKIFTEGRNFMAFSNSFFTFSRRFMSLNSEEFIEKDERNKISFKRICKSHFSATIVFTVCVWFFHVFSPTPTLPWWLNNDVFFSENCQEAWSAKRVLRESSDVLSAQPFQPKSDSREGFKFST